ncbi:MAG: twin-arginine translocase TatA/TatE family subunit [Thermotogae bacterium]|nr:twin-arginine translocase TatA/TatE family subunit [Thermotogota bacterium]
MNLGLPEIIVILVIIMLLFGPSQLPKLARGLGEAMKEFRKASSEIEGATRKEEGKEEDKT